MGNHSDKSLDKAHRHWGRPLASYYDSIRETRTSFLAQRKNLGLGAAMALRTKARSGIQKICELGERRGPVPPGYTNVVTLSLLESISKLVLLPRAVGDFAHPTLISGCIKLMSSVQESGRVTPFAYEYGYLCFRIFKIAVDVCILNRSRLFTSATSNMVSEPLADPIMLLSRHTDQAIQIQMNLEKENRTDNPHGHRIDPPLDIAGLPALLTILYEDRKAFSIAMMPSHSLGLAGTLFLLGKSLSNEASAKHNIMEMYCEVLWRYSNTSVWDKVATQLLTSHYREQAKSNWKPTFVDLEDSVTILRAANIAISPDDNRIPGPFDISAIPVLVGFAAPFVELGSEAFVPQFLDVTIGCMWNSLTSGKQSANSFIDSVRDIFYHISKILTSVTLLFSFPDPIHKQVIKTSFRHDLFELTARLILMISPRSGNLYFLGDAHNFFSKFGKLVPKEDLEDTFGGYFPEWVKFADYFFSCLSVPGISKEDQEFFTAVVRCWNAIGVAVGYDSNAIVATLHYCGYARCPHPCLTQAIQHVCSQCGEKTYCGSRCQLADWLNDHGGGSHRQLCPGSL